MDVGDPQTLKFCDKHSCMVDCLKAYLIKYVLYYCMQKSELLYSKIISWKNLKERNTYISAKYVATFKPG